VDTINNSNDKGHIRNHIISAILDTSELIKFIETKVGITLAFYGLIITILTFVKGNIYGAIKIVSKYGLCCVSIYIGVMILAFLSMSYSIFHLLETILPRNYGFPDTNELTEKQKRLWSIRLKEDKSGLTMTYNDYYDTIIKLDEDGIIKCESLELLRRNVVWNKKRSHADKGIRYFKWFVLLIGIVGIATIIVNTCVPK